MQIAKKRSFYTVLHFIPSSLKLVEYIEKVNGNSFIGSYFLSPSRFHPMAGANKIVFSCGPDMSDDDLKGELGRYLIGATDDPTTLQTFEYNINTISWINKYFRQYPIMNVYSTTTIPIMRNVKYTLSTIITPHIAANLIIQTALPRVVRLSALASEITDNGYYISLFKYRKQELNPFFPTRIMQWSAPTYTRIYEFTAISETTGFTSINMLPAEYRGKPCFYDTITNTICNEVEGSGYFKCGPYL